MACRRPRQTAIAAPGLLVLALAGSAWSETLADAGYVSPAVCAGCHSEIAANYARTGMGNSFRAVRAGTILPEFDGSTFYHAESGERFTALKRDGSYYIRRFQTSRDSKETNVFEARVDFVMGSGNRARSYFLRTPQDKLIEFPVSWYPQEGGHWAMSPGYERATHQGFSREVDYRCLFCHDAYPDIAARDAAWDGATTLPASLPEGIDCQRCHGPGRDHVAAASNGSVPEAVRAAIVNPARLTPQRRIEVCLQCHLETTSSPLPGMMLRFGRDVFSYRPGEPLADYMVYFDHAPGTGHDDKFEIVSAAYRLRKSACFRADAEFTCTTCHDPHMPDTRDEALARTNGICQGCHAEAVAKLAQTGGHTSRQDCASCHMPLRRTADTPHMLMTDHDVSAPRGAASTAPAGAATDAMPYTGNVAVYYPPQLPETPENASLLAAAQIRDLANLPDGLNQLQALLARSQDASARAYFLLADALLSTQQAARAIPVLQEAVRRDPQSWQYLYKLGHSLAAAGQSNAAEDAYRRAQRLAPDQVAIQQSLGDIAASRGDLAAAAAAYREALKSSPENAEALAQLGGILLRQGDRTAAETTLREAVRLRPEVPSNRMLLGSALVALGRVAEARDEFAEVLRMGVPDETARSAWFRELAASGNPGRARQAYEKAKQAGLTPARLNLGIAQAMLGDEESALTNLREAVDLDPESAIARLNLAIALEHAGSFAEARKQLEQALALQPDLTAAADALKRLPSAQPPGR